LRAVAPAELVAASLVATADDEVAERAAGGLATQRFELKRHGRRRRRDPTEA
jgi:hypothetical protein